MKYLFNIAYNGSNYHGWQRQDNTPQTIQEVLESTLSIILQSEITVMGCGRTDTGVHASDFYFHTEINRSLDCEKIVYKLNKMLPADIAAYRCRIVDKEFHARFDAKSRSYTYYLSCRKPVFNADTCYYYPFVKSLNLELLNKICDVLKEHKDFYPFCKFGSDNKTTFCVLKECYWQYDTTQELYLFHVTADRFLRGMIRLMVGACLNIDKGKLSLQELQSALKNRNRLSTDWSVPPNGLFLDSVKY